MAVALVCGGPLQTPVAEPGGQGYGFRDDAMTVDSQLTIDVAQSNGTVVVRLTGELDCAVDGEVIATINEAASIAGVTAMRLDVSAIRFIDSSGIRCLIFARQAAHDHDLIFTLAYAHNGPVLRVLEICGLTDLFIDDEIANAL